MHPPFPAEGLQISKTSQSIEPFALEDRSKDWGARYEIWRKEFTHVLQCSLTVQTTSPKKRLI